MNFEEWLAAVKKHADDPSLEGEFWQEFFSHHGSFGCRFRKKRSAKDIEQHLVGQIASLEKMLKSHREKMAGEK